MFSPNMAIKFVSIYMLVFGILSLIYLEGFNRSLGGFMIIYSIVIIQRLTRSGLLLYKFTLLRINQILLSSIIILFSLYIVNKHDTSYNVLAVPLTTLVMIYNYATIQNFTFKINN